MIKNKKHIIRDLFSFFIMIVALLSVTGGCAESSTGNQFEKKLQGKYGYIHEPKEIILELKADNTAIYENAKYTYSCDSEYIHLVSNDKNKTKLDLRYLAEDDHFYIYKTTEYVYDPIIPQDGLVGVWRNAENNWSFNFSDKGTFMEDGYFTGHYYTEGDRLKLVYETTFEDTNCYFKVEGTTLTVEYPWEVVKSE